MDMREASAMTEASGLVDDPDGVGRASGAVPGADTGGNPRPRHAGSRQGAIRLSEQLRKVTVKAPLQALLAAFLLGVWVARRR
jgi:hypothetical protein